MTRIAGAKIIVRLVPKKKDLVDAAMHVVIAGVLMLAGVLMHSSKVLLGAQLFAVVGVWGLIGQVRKAIRDLFIVEVLDRLFARRRQPEDDVWSGGV